MLNIFIPIDTDQRLKIGYWTLSILLTRPSPRRRLPRWRVSCGPGGGILGLDTYFSSGSCNTALFLRGIAEDAQRLHQCGFSDRIFA
jgi:hypothetical protein